MGRWLRRFGGAFLTGQGIAADVDGDQSAANGNAVYEAGAAGVIDGFTTS